VFLVEKYIYVKLKKAFNKITHFYENNNTTRTPKQIN